MAATAQGAEETKLPLYERVFQDLRRRIQVGEFPRGSVLPTEKELCEQYAVSVITIKRAVAELAVEGLVASGRGLRTRVLSAAGTTHYVTNVDGLLRGLQQQFRNATFEILAFGIVPASEEIAHALRIEVGARLQQVSIVATRNGQRYSYWHSYVPERLAPLFPRASLAKKTRMLLFQTLGIFPSSGSQFIAACPAPDEAARVFRVKKGSPMLLLTRALFDQDGRPIEYLVSYSPWDRHEYGIAIQGDGAPSR